MKTSRPISTPSRRARRPVATAPRSAGDVAAPQVFVPPIITRQPDGSITVRAGQPVLLAGGDEIKTEEAARLTGLSARRIQALADEGALVEGLDWRRNGRRGYYYFARASILRYAKKLPR